MYNTDNQWRNTQYYRYHYTFRSIATTMDGIVNNGYQKEPEDPSNTIYSGAQNQPQTVVDNQKR